MLQHGVIQPIGFGITGNGPIGGWTMNDAPKPDYKARSGRVCSSIIHSKRDSSRYRRTPSEEGDIGSKRETSMRVDGEMSWDLNSTLPLPALYYTYRADTGFRSTSHYMTYDARDGNEGIERRDERVNWSTVCVCVYSRNGKRSHRRAYIALVSCCARINREMMRPASGEMSSEPAIASWCTRCGIDVPFSRLFRSSLLLHDTEVPVLHIYVLSI